MLYKVTHCTGCILANTIQRENFLGRKLSRFGGNRIFVEKTFADCSLVSLPKDATPPNFVEKTFVNSYKTFVSFLPRKVSHYTVTMSHQLHWGYREMGISCPEWSQMAGLVQKVGRSSSKTLSLTQVSFKDHACKRQTHD